jgi:PhnB protein
MSEQLFIEKIDEAIDAIITDPEAVISAEAGMDELSELVMMAIDLTLLPRASFRLNLREQLIRSANMKATGKQGDASAKPGYQTITPYLTVKKAEELVDFVKEVFGGQELFRAIGSAGGLHCEVMVGDSKLMIGGMESVEEIPTALHLYVPNADEIYQRALQGGATSIEEPVDQFYGDREAGIKDPTGNVWWIATHKLAGEGTYIPAGMRSVTPFLHPVGADGLIDFMKTAFGADEVSREASPEGMVHHAVVRIGDSLIEMGEAHGDAQPMPPALYTFVSDVDETYQRALDAGAQSLKEPEDQSYGHRMAWVKDAWGNIWYLAKATE